MTSSDGLHVTYWQNKGYGYIYKLERQDASTGPIWTVFACDQRYFAEKAAHPKRVYPSPAWQYLSTHTDWLDVWVLNQELYRPYVI